MAKVTASQVKALRDATGAGMMECKKALEEASGDFDGAVDVLRTRGLAAAAKKAGRATNEGRVAAFVDADAHKGALVQVNCETDFVALNEKFQAYCDTFAAAAAAIEPADLDAFKAASYDGKTIEEILTSAIHVIGENIQVSTVKNLSVAGTGALVSYLHMNGKIGVLVAFNFEDEKTGTKDLFQQTAKDIAMQIAATDPVALNQDFVPAEIREHEMNIYKEQAANSGKPENIQEKIATGRMHKFYKENCLVEQDFVKNPDVTVQQYLDTSAKKLGDKITIASFARIALGD